MWPARNPGEDARLYSAVEAVSEFALKLGINIPTGKDSLSMTQKYPGNEVVYAPGTVIISAAAEVADITGTVSPALAPSVGSKLIYVDLSKNSLKLSGSSFAQSINMLGNDVPTVNDATYFALAFNTVQSLITGGAIRAGHDISSGGIITALLEMCFPVPDVGMTINVEGLGDDIVTILFSENPGIILQIDDENTVLESLRKAGITYHLLGHVSNERRLTVQYKNELLKFRIDELRDIWFKTSHLLDSKQRSLIHAEKRFQNYKKQILEFKFPASFDGQFEGYKIDQSRRTPTGIKAAIIREKGVNGDREMAYTLYLAGFDVKDIHMTDLVSGREDLTDVNMIVFVGGFSNSDVLGSAKGWAGAFLYNARAKEALDNFYKRTDTLSLGVCNGCQLMMELGLLYPEWKDHPRMHHNGSRKFESAFVNVTIPETNSILLKSMMGSRLGVWVAHGEGRFSLPEERSLFEPAAYFSQREYPGNPSESDFAVAALSSRDGRHLGIMPHLERSLFPWNWAHYPAGRKADKISPWIEPFVNAREWVKKQSPR
jgi:phosphoribosylformylglycinamidine synthase